jgi:protein SCO1/2
MILLTLAAVLASPVSAALTQAQLSGVGATPPAGVRLPAGLDFIDQAGRSYRLTEATVPTVLLFADYSCRHICGPGVTLTAGGLHDAGLKPGRDYRMIVIGMDQDGAALAAKLAAERLKGLDAEAAAIKLLTGTQGTVARAESMLGYHAAYDPQSDQFAHDAALYIFTESGRLSSLLPETASTAPQLSAAIDGARRGLAYRPPPTVRNDGLGGTISAICYGLASAHGLYAGPVVLGLRIGGVLICLGLALFVIGNVRRQRKSSDAA